MDSHLPCLLTHGMADAAGPPVLLTEYVLINLGFEGLGLIEPCGITGAWRMTASCSLSAEDKQKGAGPSAGWGDVYHQASENRS